MNPTGTATTKIDRVMRRSIAITADTASGSTVDLEVLRVGVWRTLYHGDFMITPADLEEYVDHFNGGIGLPGEGKDGAPIDYKHESWDKAAGWIKSLRIVEDSLIATVEWTPAGRQAILDGEFKYFSPEFYPKGRGGWCDAEDYEYVVDNVLVGGGLTNIPLFKGLSGLKASANGQDIEIQIADKEPVKANKEQPMDLTTVRAKKADELTEEEKTFVAEHKADLTAEEQTKFGLEVAAPNADEPNKDDPANKPKEGDEVPANQPTDGVPANVAASLRSGESVVIKASELKSLQESQNKFETQVAASTVKAAAARGAIKADRIDAWTKRLVAADTASRKDLEEELAALPSNELMASTYGAGDDNAGDATDIVEELKTKTLARVEASKDANGHPTMSYGQAQDALLREDKDLSDRVTAARK